ncbi:MAG: PP2C family protein-serine/threonine phosphatase, partial [Termitinemataceae bacterium]
TMYYALTDDKGIFQGIFSIHDLNDHLARITQDDIEMAGRLQARLLARSSITRTECSLMAWTRSARGVGGDFFYLAEVPGDRLFAALCDVSGKGVAASLIVSMVWGILSVFDFRKGLRELVSQINSAVVNTFHLEKYLTGLFMVVDPHKEKLIIADMGHSHVLLKRGDRVTSVKARNLNLPLGVELEITPVITGLQLQKGDSVFVYSDGITEQENSEGHEFGEKRLIKLVHELSGDYENIVNKVQGTFDEYRQGIPQQDDISFLLFDYHL